MKLKTLGLKAHDQELALDRLMVLSGPNGSGKSTFAEAIRFLALGYVPALGKRPQDTAALQREPLMASILTLPDGRVVARSLEETDQGFHSRAECSWLEGDGGQRHAAEILALFGRDEQDVAEALDIRQLLNATPQQRADRIAGLLAIGHASVAERSELLRRLFAERLGGARSWDETLGPSARHLEQLLRESDPAGLLAWAADERRRAAARLHLKTKAREELDARVAPLPEADEERFRELEDERGRLERDLGALEEKALQMRLREEQRERLWRQRDQARAAHDEATAERRRWEFRARDLARVPEELQSVERELDETIPDALPTAWAEVAEIAESLRALARDHAGTAMVRTLVHAQRLSQLARQALRRGGTEEDAARRRRALLQRRDRHRRTLQALTAEDRRTAADLDRAALRVESLDREIAALPAAASDAPLPEEELHRKLHDVRRALADLGEVRAARRQLQLVAEEEARARVARDAHAALEWALQRLQEREIMDSRERLGGLLESMLRAAGRAEVPFFVASRGVCRIGWRTPAGKEIPVQSLSGGEWILFATALAATVIILRNAPLRVLLVEAGEADAHTLQALLDAIRSVADRLTCAIVMTPRNVNAPDWTVVRRFGPPVVQSA